MALLKKVVLAVVAFGVVAWLFVSTLEDTIAEPYSLAGAGLSGWALELAPPGGRGLTLLGLRPPPLLRATLFDQLFNRTMESMNGPADDLVPVVLRSEYRDGLASAVSPDEILAAAREAGLDRIQLEPVCMAVKREPFAGRTRQFYFVLFDAAPIQAFRADLARRADGQGAALEADGFEVVLPVAASDTAFESWWPLRVDRDADCQAPVSSGA